MQFRESFLEREEIPIARRVMRAGKIAPMTGVTQGPQHGGDISEDVRRIDVLVENTRISALGIDAAAIDPDRPDY